jgi:hypothetical protein
VPGHVGDALHHSNGLGEGADARSGLLRLDVSDAGDAPDASEALGVDQRHRDLGEAIEALHPNEMLLAVPGGGEPAPGISLLEVGRGLRIVRRHRRHLLLGEEATDMQVARFFEEGAHLLVRIVGREAAADLSLEGDVAARVDAAPVESRTKHQPPVEEVRQAALGHVQEPVAHQRDRRALVVDEVGQLLGRQPHPRLAAPAFRDLDPLVSPGQGPGFTVGLDAEVDQRQLAGCGQDQVVVGLEEGG